MLVQAKNILIATGGRAMVPPIEGKDLTIISDQVLDLPKKPERCNPCFLLFLPGHKDLLHHHFFVGC